MSKVKRILSVIMAMVMVLAMSVPTFAAGENATITLKRFDKANKVEYMQIIQKDETKTSGWAFTNGAGKCFTEAFELTDSEDAQQQVIWGLIKYNDNSVKLPTGVTAVTATAAKIDLALSKVAALTGFTVAKNKESIEVNAAGVYAIKAEETGFTYKTATAYVGFGEPYPTLTGAEVTAKKSPTSVEKIVADDDHVVAIGDIVTYTIEAYVPFIDAANTDNRTFTITDKITGADYYLAGPNSVNNVTMVGKDGKVEVGTIVVNEDDKGFTIDLSELVADTSNPNAGKKITVTYTAKVKELTVENTAGSHTADATYGGNNVPVKLFTGEITLLKYGDSDEANVLKDAEFEVSKDEAATPLKFKLQENGNYRYAPDAEYASTVVKTNAEGKIVVEGLNVGTYHFKETKAPEGYSINTDGKDITLTQTGVATAIVKASGKLNDTKLKALPSTGGIGTTIFTIGGCAIMIVAAGLFFATRRKTQK